MKQAEQVVVFDKRRRQTPLSGEPLRITGMADTAARIFGLYQRARVFGERLWNMLHAKDRAPGSPESEWIQLALHASARFSLIVYDVLVTRQEAGPEKAENLTMLLDQAGKLEEKLRGTLAMRCDYFAFPGIPVKLSAALYRTAQGNFFYSMLTVETLAREIVRLGKHTLSAVHITHLGQSVSRLEADREVVTPGVFISSLFKFRETMEDRHTIKTEEISKTQTLRPRKKAAAMVQFTLSELNVAMSYLAAVETFLNVLLCESEFELIRAQRREIVSKDADAFFFYMEVVTGNTPRGRPGGIRNDMATKTQSRSIVPVPSSSSSPPPPLPVRLSQLDVDALCAELDAPPGRCLRCKNKDYKSKEEQVADWPEHSKVCVQEQQTSSAMLSEI